MGKVSEYQKGVVGQIKRLEEKVFNLKHQLSRDENMLQILRDIDRTAKGESNDETCESASKGNGNDEASGQG